MVGLICEGLCPRGMEATRLLPLGGMGGGSWMVWGKIGGRSWSLGRVLQKFWRFPKIKGNQRGVVNRPRTEIGSRSPGHLPPSGCKRRGGIEARLPVSSKRSPARLFCRHAPLEFETLHGVEVPGSILSGPLPIDGLCEPGLLLQHSSLCSLTRSVLFPGKPDRWKERSVDFVFA